jgi:hypothetical protein
LSRPEPAALRAVLAERGELEPTGPRVPLSRLVLDVVREVGDLVVFEPILVLDVPPCVVLPEGFDPAALDVLVEAGLFAEPPLIAPEGGKEGRPLGPRSWLLPFKRFSACIS